MNLQNIADKLPNNSITWAGFGQPVEINLNSLTGDADLNPESNALEMLIKLVDAAFKVQKDLNAVRASEGLPLLSMIDRAASLDEEDNVIFTYSLSARVDTAAALNNVSIPVAISDEE